MIAFLALHVTLKAQQVTMPACAPVWKYALPGSQLGLNTLQCYDYDGDGLQELIVGVHNGGDYTCNYWYKLEWDAVNEKFDQVWVSQFYKYDDAHLPSVIESFDADNDGQPEIVVGYSDSRVDVIDPVTMNTDASFEIPAWDDEVIFRIIRADADNDGQDEIVCCTTNATYLMNVGSYTSDIKIWYGAKDMRCGNVDALPGVELVYGNGSVVNLSNGQPQLLWDFTTTADNYRKPVKLFDLDTDGILEIFYLNDDLFIYDAVNKQQRLMISHGYDEITEVLVADTDEGDGREIILGRDDGLTFYDLEGVYDREYRDPYQSGAYGMKICDIDNDGKQEMVFTSGGGSSVEDRVNIYDLQMDKVVYKSPVVSGPIRGFKVADADSDGTNEFIFLNGEYDVKMTYMNPVDRTVEWLAPTPGSTGYNSVMAYDISDFDNDGEMEMVHLSHDTYESVTVTNALTHEIEWVKTLPYGDEYTMQSIMIKDADQDGMQEFVTASSNYINFIDPVDFTIEWTSPAEWSSGYYTTDAEFTIANTDADQNLEMVWLSGKGMLVIDCYTKQLEYEMNNVRQISLYDLDQDGISEIFFSVYVDWQGTELGYVNCVTGEKTIFSIEYFTEIAVLPVPGRNTPVLAGMRYGDLFFMTIDGKGITEPITITDNDYTSSYNQLYLNDYDKDGIKELFVIVYASINEFDLSCYLPLSFEEPVTESPIRLSPNPATDIISFGTTGLTTDATIINMQGQAIIHLAAGTLRADVSELPSGVYVIRPVSGNHSSPTRFIKL